MNKLLGVTFSTLIAVSSAMAISATRVGPVSTYGELKANGNKLVGSCPAFQNTPVQVKGMSLFWSSAADSSTTFYSEKAVNLMVKDMGIQVLRFAMGVKSDFDKGRGYLTGGETLQKAYLKNVVQAAVENDIYVIIDWHIESGEGYTSDAVKFFEYAAKEYGKYNNVIFEVWNEPKDGASAQKVAEHANAIIPAIRKYSDNLILVGSPEWSSHPEQCATSGINDKNFACTLHFYAATHSSSGDYSKRAEQAMQSGVPVFASEWGTVSADGNGAPNQGESSSWVSWMNQKNVSWANWSASAQNEQSAAFTRTNLDAGLTYSTSGNMVKGFLGNVPAYKDCGLQNGDATESSGFSTGISNGTKTDFIDDLEDGDRYAYTGGWWSAFADSDDDNDGRGKTSITNKKFTNDFGEEVYDVLLPSDGGKNTSKYMAGITGIHLSQGQYSYGPYVAIGLNLKRDTSIIDLSACKSISYKFKGAAHNFRVETSLVTNWNFHHVAKDASEEWKEVQLSWDQFNQEDWGDNATHFNLQSGMNKVQRFAWEVKGLDKIPDSDNQPAFNFLYIDDVRCDGASISAITGNGSAERPVSSSSRDVLLSSSSSQPIESSSSLSSAVDLNAVVDIDDVEDLDEVAKTTGTWYAYNDHANGGESVITNTYDESLPGYVVVFPGSKDATNGTQGFVGITGIKWNQAAYEYEPFVALGLNTVQDTSMGVDLSGCLALSYRYKGASHVFKVQDGLVTDYAFHQYKQDSSSIWKTSVINWDDLLQPTWTSDAKDLNKNAIKKLAWEVVGYKDYEADPDLDYLYIDDVKCVGKTQSLVSASIANTFKISMVQNVLNISTDKVTKVQIFDMMGNMVKAQNNLVGSSQISLEDLNKGNYIVRVKSQGRVKSAKISVK